MRKVDILGYIFLTIGVTITYGFGNPDLGLLINSIALGIFAYSIYEQVNKNWR